MMTLRFGCPLPPSCKSYKGRRSPSVCLLLFEFLRLSLASPTPPRPTSCCPDSASSSPPTRRRPHPPIWSHLLLRPRTPDSAPSRLKLLLYGAQFLVLNSLFIGFSVSVCVRMHVSWRMSAEVRLQNIVIVIIVVNFTLSLCCVPFCKLPVYCHTMLLSIPALRPCHTLTI